LFVVAAPSGGGKTSLTRALLERERGIRLSVSYTTRPPRSGEREGVDYHFVSTEQFMALRDAASSRARPSWQLVRDVGELAPTDRSGPDVLLEIDWQGAAQVRRLIPSSIQVFILPPSLALLEERLHRRGQDDKATIAQRLEAARDEIRHCAEFNYVIINQDFATAVDDLSAIVRASRLRAAQQCVRHEALIAQLI
jgi:guanylate kinase